MVYRYRLKAIDKVFVPENYYFINRQAEYFKDHVKIEEE